MNTAPVIRDDDIDLNPLIDVVTMLLVFFLIGGRISDTTTVDQITVPPTLTGSIPTSGPQLLVINLRGDDQRLEMTIGPNRFAGGALERQPFVDLRELLDRVHQRAPKRWQGGVEVADVALELRADGRTPYHMIQQVLAIAADSVDPAAATPRVGDVVRRPFTDLRFTTRDAGG